MSHQLFEKRTRPKCDIALPLESNKAPFHGQLAWMGRRSTRGVFVRAAAGGALGFHYSSITGSWTRAAAPTLSSDMPLRSPHCGPRNLVSLLNAPVVLLSP